MFELVPAGTHIDFIGKRRIAGAISLALLLAGLLAALLPQRGVRFGIDFAGGTEVQVLFAEGVEVGEGAIRSVVNACGVADPSVVRYGEPEIDEFLIRFRVDGDLGEPDPEGCPITPEQEAILAGGADVPDEGVEEPDGADEGGRKGELVDRIDFALANAIGPLTVERVEFVGPRVGAELRRDGLYALGIASLLILAYVAFRFSARFAPGAVVALLHDILITAGLFVILGLEFDLRVLAALLAIIGYSLNDTIIIYDRIRENMELHTKHDLVDVLNRSVNQTLSRTVLTSGTTVVAVLALLFLGGEVIEPFALAMAIGIVVGTYSSVFIAAPTLLLLEQRFGERETGAASAAREKAARKQGHPLQGQGRREKRKKGRSARS